MSPTEDAKLEDHCHTREIAARNRCGSDGSGEGDRWTMEQEWHRQRLVAAAGEVANVDIICR